MINWVSQILCKFISVFLAMTSSTAVCDLLTLCTRNIRSLPLHVNEVGYQDVHLLSLQEADVLQKDCGDIAVSLREYGKSIVDC